MQELAATAPGFVNASMEFDVASLRPTYRLLWGSAGESNALAVAQGLGFAPPLVAAAREVRGLLRPGRQRGCHSCVAAPLHLPCTSLPSLPCPSLPYPSPPLRCPSRAQVAEELHHSSAKMGQRSQMLQASLVEQVAEARLAASEAAAARAAADAAAAAAEQELASAQEQQAALRKASAAAKNAGTEAQQRVQKVLSDVRAGRLTAREAEERLRALERQAAPPESAAMRLMGLRAAVKVKALAQGGLRAPGGSAIDLLGMNLGWL